MAIVTRDNCSGHVISDEQDRFNLNLISDKTIQDLVNDESNPDLLIYPESFNDNSWKDDIEESCILSLAGDKLKTGNVVGFIGIRGEKKVTELSIHSRFTDNDEDYFLHYMLQRIMSINMFNLPHSFTDQDAVFDFLKFLFPSALKEAMSQGIYKEYVTNHYNDSHVHGSIDIPSFIKRNIPFNGRVSSKAREHDYDNNMTELIRHTIEVIRQDPIGRGIIAGNKETVDLVRIIENVTPSYSKNDRGKILAKNLRPKSHPFFTKYRQLQRLCIQILRHEGLKYTSREDSNRVYGVIFDCAWLWEEYLNSVFIEHSLEIVHPGNKTRNKGLALFTNGKYVRYPDFYKKDHSMVMDAKYKRMRNNQDDRGHNSIDRDDMHQLITYMYRLRSLEGLFLFPNENRTGLFDVGQLGGYCGNVRTCSLRIPQIPLPGGKAYKYTDFVKDIKKEELLFVQAINQTN